MNWVIIMFKALLKKQLLEFFSGMFNRNNGKSNKSGSKAVFIALMAFVFMSFLFMFASMAYMLVPILEGEGKWIYFSVFGILATLLGIFGSVFVTYNTLYEAKDNDLLLSMPIPERMILFTRITGLYLSALLFEALVLIPATAVAALTGNLNGTAIALCVVNIPVLPLAALSISCVFGRILGMVSSRLRNKSLISVLFSIVFFAVYYFVAMRLNLIINEIIYNAEHIGEQIKSFLYPFYKLGLGCTGDAVSYLLFAACCLIVFAAVYAYLSVGFIKIVTSKKGMKKVRYKEKAVKKKSVRLAFLKKELLYLKSSPAYMLNCAIGSVGLLILTVMFIVKGKDVINMISAVQMSADTLSIIVCALGCFAASANNLTAPSISLEAKNLWLLKSVPAEIRDIFLGKILMHILVTGIPLAVFSIVSSVILENSVFVTALTLIISELFVALCAEAGLVFNLIFPKTDWTNETAPIKQSISSTLGMFFGLILTVIFIGGAFLLGTLIAAELYLAVLGVFFAVSAALIFRWLCAGGVQRFSDIG